MEVMDIAVSAGNLQSISFRKTEKSTYLICIRYECATEGKEAIAEIKESELGPCAETIQHGRRDTIVQPIIRSFDRVEDYQTKTELAQAEKMGEAITRIRRDKK